MQGGEDRMRLLAPVLGARPRLQPVYTDVHVAAAGRPGRRGRLVAVGHLPGQPKVTVTTTYTLQPDARMLEVRTSVENGTDAQLPGFGLATGSTRGARSATCRGRGSGRRAGPARRTGRRSSGAATSGRLLGPVLSPTDGVHEAGFSTLTYATTDLAPGQERRVPPLPAGRLRRAGEGLAGGGPRAGGAALHGARGAEGRGERQARAGRLRLRAAGLEPAGVRRAGRTRRAWREFRVPKGRYDVSRRAPRAPALGRAHAGHAGRRQRHTGPSRWRRPPWPSWTCAAA